MRAMPGGRAVSLHGLDGVHFAREFPKASDLPMTPFGMSSSSPRVPDRLMSIVGTMRLSESVRSRTSSMYLVPSNSSKMTPSRRFVTR